MSDKGSIKNNPTKNPLIALVASEMASEKAGNVFFDAEKDNAYNLYRRKAGKDGAPDTYEPTNERRLEALSLLAGRSVEDVRRVLNSKFGLKSAEEAVDVETWAAFDAILDELSDKETITAKDLREILTRIFASFEER